jgi:hypothetical protein
MAGKSKSSQNSNSSPGGEQYAFELVRSKSKLLFLLRKTISLSTCIINDYLSQNLCLQADLIYLHDVLLGDSQQTLGIRLHRHFHEMKSNCSENTVGSIYIKAVINVTSTPTAVNFSTKASNSCCAFSIYCCW